MTEELKRRLLAAGEKIKAKGWKSASLELGVTYLGIFDRPPGSLDPMITFTAAIRTSSPHNHVDGWTFESMEEAVAAMEATAEKMPTFVSETEVKAAALAKLSDHEKRLLGVRHAF